VEEEKEVKAKQDKGKRKNGHNYCYQNIEEAKKLVPRQPKRKYVDTRKGDAHDLQCSGLEPQYVLKKVCYYVILQLLLEYAPSNCIIMQFKNVTK
jgi:hypothetical protein